MLDEEQETLWVQVSNPIFRGDDRPAVLAGIDLRSPGPPHVLALPRRFSAFTVISGRMLGRSVDSLGVHHLSVKRIVTAGS